MDTRLDELVRRAQEDWASSIEDRETLQDLSDKGNKYASYELYQKYKWGDEKQGIFIDKIQAKKYFDLAGDLPSQFEEEWDDSDDPGEPNPSEYEYTLTGDADTLKGICTMIDNLCQKYGTPDNEFGLFVPQRILMKLLVGSDTEFYHGNVLTMEQPAPDQLVITTEADNGDPLLYALRQRFPNLTVEIKD